MSNQKLDYFYYNDRKYLQFSEIVINYDPETGTGETVYFVHAFGEGRHITDVVLYRQFPKGGQCYYVMMKYEQFVASIHRIYWVVDPHDIGLKKEKISIKQCPHIIIGIIVFIILIPILLLCKGGIFWLLIVSIGFVVWLYKSIKKLTVVRRTDERRRW